ncbi:hypothetical protein E2C01_100935 [Portunus trituberculatus]|uniref:Uncharacterized protein n=1 Tax=Portunus trituberculatus TaxID=210409 RepID=A0A5B7KEL3_PORTR|nr:hypothetical protein [Portunus trituberculatus]
MSFPRAEENNGLSPVRQTRIQLSTYPLNSCSWDPFTLLTSSLPASSFSSSTSSNTAKEFSVPTRCVALSTFLLFAPEDTTRHSSWPFVSLLSNETAGIATPSVAEFTQQNSACRSKIRPRNSCRT